MDYQASLPSVLAKSIGSSYTVVRGEFCRSWTPSQILLDFEASMTPRLTSHHSCQSIFARYGVGHPKWSLQARFRTFCPRQIPCWHCSNGLKPGYSLVLLRVAC